MKYTFFTLIIGIVSGLALSSAWMPVIEATSATSIINSSNNTKAFDTKAKSSTEYDHKNAAGSSN
ncbi:6693_t:CDS:2, partial [Entrophospora sp. SA101]